MGDPWRGMICLSLAVGFEEDRARLGLPAAVDRLRDALAYNGLTLDGDERLLAGVLDGRWQRVQRRIGGGDLFGKQDGIGRGNRGALVRGIGSWRPTTRG
jgi:hypothetical protein